MRVKKPFNGTIEEAAAEVKKLEAAGLNPIVKLTIEVDMGDEYVRVRERAKVTRARPVKRLLKAQPSDDVAEPVN